jgi:SMI1 / KNR4 family (SUKH-1)
VRPFSITGGRSLRRALQVKAGVSRTVDVIELIKQRARDPKRATEGGFGLSDRRHLPPPATIEAIEAAEHALGFRLPVLLRRLYLEVGNGGFGPGYGLIGVEGGTPDVDSKAHDIVALYKAYSGSDPEDPLWRWEPGLLPVANLGCGMYACVACDTPHAPVIWFEPNAHIDGVPWDDSLIPLAKSTEEWLMGWLSGEDLLERAWNAKFGVAG